MRNIDTRNGLFCLALAFGVLLHTRAPGATTDPTDLRVGDATKRYVVTLKHEADQDRCASEHAIHRSRSFRHAINGFVADLNPVAAERLKKDSRVEAIAEDRIIASTSGQLIPAGLRRTAADIFPPAMIDGTDNRVSVDVAIIDSGIQSDHPDLNVVDSVVFGYPELVDPNDDHGTACAGIIGALDNDFGVVGIVPGVRLWSIRHTEFDESLGKGTAYLSDTLAAFNYVAAHADQISVVNCSFGTFYGQESSFVREQYREAIRGLVNRGVVVVAAAGNDNSDISGPNGVMGDSDDSVPAALPEVMAVSAMDPTTDEFAAFSNFSRSRHAVSFVNSPGAAIDVVAPGMRIDSTTLRSGYRSGLTGTSFACPHAAGLVAIYIATHGRATNAAGVYAIRQAIVDAAQPQSEWRTIPSLDPDTNHEGLAVASLSWATNVPMLLNIVKATSSVDVSFSTVPGYVHTLQSAESLHPGNPWTNLLTTNGTGTGATLNAPTVDTSRFYRLMTQPVPWPQPAAFQATNLGSLGSVANGTYWSVGNGVAGAIAGDAYNRAIRAAGDFSGGSIRIPFLPALNPDGPFSFELWFKPARVRVSGLLNSVHSEPLAPHSLRGTGWNLTQINPSFTSANGFYFLCYNTTGDVDYTGAAVNLSINTNAWYHLVGTWDRMNLRLYVNGSIADSVAMTTFRTNSGSTLGFAGGGNVGDFDEPAIYTNALSASQVFAHYEAGTNAAPSIPYSQIILNDNPAGYWRFDEH